MSPLLLPPHHFTAVTDLRQNENKSILSNSIFSLIQEAAFGFCYTYLFNPAWHSPKEIASIHIYTVQQILLLFTLHFFLQNTQNTKIATYLFDSEMFFWQILFFV